jgi:hypothetical protein
MKNLKFLTEEARYAWKLLSELLPRKVMEDLAENVELYRGVLSDGGNIIADHLKKIPLENQSVYLQGVRDASNIYLPIIKELAGELKNHESNMLSESAIRERYANKLRGKPKEIYIDKKRRDDFVKFYQTNSKRKTANMFKISTDAVDSLSRAIGIKKNKTVR